MVTQTICHSPTLWHRKCSCNFYNIFLLVAISDYQNFFTDWLLMFILQMYLDTFKMSSLTFHNYFHFIFPFALQGGRFSKSIFVLWKVLCWKWPNSSTIQIYECSLSLMVINIFQKIIHDPRNPWSSNWYFCLISVFLIWTNFLPVIWVFVQIILKM